MAGLGRRTFQAGEVLTASNVMAYLQDQAVMNFAGTAARGSAIGTAVAEGMVSYLADNNFVQAYDGTAWRSLGGVQVVSGTATRDALLPSPVQGDSVFRNDLGAVETYYGLYNSSTNPGGRDTAGWYINDRQTGLIPVKPSTVTIATGTGSANSIGTVSFSGATVVSLDGVFTSKYKHYRIIYSQDSATSTGVPMYLRFRNGGADNTASNYYWGGYFARISGVTGAHCGSGSSVLQLGYIAISAFSEAVIDVLNPYISKITTFNFQAFGQDGTNALTTFANGTYNTSTQFDGFSLFPASGNFTGQVTVYGYND